MESCSTSDAREREPLPMDNFKHLRRISRRQFFRAGPHELCSLRCLDAHLVALRYLAPFSYHAGARKGPSVARSHFDSHVGVVSLEKARPNRHKMLNMLHAWNAIQRRQGDDIAAGLRARRRVWRRSVLFSCIDLESLAMRDVLEETIPFLGHKALLWIGVAVLLVKLLRKILEEHRCREGDKSNRGRRFVNGEHLVFLGGLELPKVLKVQADRW